MQERGPCVLFAPFREKAPGDGRGAPKPVHFREQSEGDESIEEERGGTRVAATSRRNRVQRCALTRGSEDVELDRRENDAALLEAANGLLQLVGQHAGRILRLDRGEVAVAVEFDLCDESVFVAIDEPLDRRVVPEMALDELRDVFRSHTGIPDSVRVDDDVRPTLAEPERPARRELNVVHQAEATELATKRVDHPDRSSRRARRHSFGLLLLTGVDVITEWFHGSLRSRRLPVQSNRRGVRNHVRA